MSLKVSSLHYKGHIPPRPFSAVLDEVNGILTIGRADTNKLVLNDDSVSREHAEIRYENGCYYLKDQSTNGTLIQGRNLLLHGDKAELLDGDRLSIGDYDLAVSIRPEKVLSEVPPVMGPSLGLSSIFGPEQPGQKMPSHGEKSAGKLPFGEEIDSGAEGETLEASSSSRRSDGEGEGQRLTGNFSDIEYLQSLASSREPQLLGDELDLDKLFKDADSLDRDSWSLKSLSEEPTIDASDQEPGRFLDGGLGGREPEGAGSELLGGLGAQAEGQKLGDLWGETVESVLEQPKERLREHPSPGKPFLDDSAGAEPGHREDQKDWLSCFLEGAGIEHLKTLDLERHPEVMRTAGSVLRELALGLCTILRARTELKSDIRLRVTMLHPTGNNPFKFSPRVEDVLELLLTRNHPSYSSGAEAVREGFEDVMNHQLAFTAGVQAALTELLGRFDPRRFWDQGMKGFGFQRKIRSWDAYSAAYGRLVEEALEGFLGEAFIKAYEEQMEKLHHEHERY